ncbi:Fur family transcriptional regulator [Rickettsiales endosymbiont of Trichoplax sp. H2]|uniref:Fur family transcriptional regulator n=1 Tax=Rickettsiales endosymbiont of Trichoplax sp. H2 TaxID=2021221 RepID=UPI0012B2892B|nr:transcriptional repressor [Rickettsiales endosymbiont of Trichoplax sp. H2]MSO14056.1 Ferric uptake regulation protein [Rickettsiales endosymbiont of Trichoplax sp. H2]
MNNIEKACVEKNLKLTSQRRIIAEVLSNSNDHPDVEELYARANKIDSKISLATIYRTLNLFEQFGLIKKLEIGEGKARYEEFKKANEHFHLVNMETGYIVEFKNKELEKLKERIAKKLGFKLVNSKLELYGVPIKK